MLTFTLKRGYLQFYINDVEMNWGEIKNSNYNLSTENYFELLKKIEIDPLCSNVKDVLMDNFKQIYHINFKYSYHFKNGKTVIISDKPFVNDGKEHYGVCEPPYIRNRNFNHLNVESAIKSFNEGICIECNGDHQECSFNQCK